jgi:hypothetical protein
MSRLDLSSAHLRSVANRRAFTRRDFLRSAGAGSGAALLGWSPLRAMAAAPSDRKCIVVTFGGGARDEETFAPEGQENIPHLMNELIPQAAFCTQVVNHGILGHYVATASLATGNYETFDNFVTVAPENPTIFEYYRKALGRPASDAWVIAPSNGFNRIGQSGGRHFAPGYGAEVVLPKQLLTAALHQNGADPDAFRHFLQDNYENLLYAPASSPDGATDAQAPSSEVHLAQLGDMLRLSVDDFTAHAQTLSSADELSVYVMRRVMDRFAPSLLWITLHDMDVAHTGAYSLYIEGIRRTDRLCAEIWQAAQSHPEYRGRTTLLILPDFGRDSDFDAGGNGFQHHRTGGALSRTTWMMALGPHIRPNTTVDRPLDSLDLVPTLGSLLGCPTPLAQGRPVTEVL